MATYLTAMEARVKAQEAQSLNGHYLRKETDLMLDQIEAASLSGNFEMTVGFILHKVIKDRLEDMGYKVKYHSDQRDGDWTVVSW